MEDIASERSYVCLDGDNGIVGTFYFRVGEEPTYLEIFDGAWLDDAPTGLFTDRLVRKTEGCRSLHRPVPGAVRQHPDRYPSDNIYLENGAERLAYQYSIRPATPENRISRMDPPSCRRPERPPENYPAFIIDEVVPVDQHQGGSAISPITAGLRIDSEARIHGLLFSLAKKAQTTVMMISEGMLTANVQTADPKMP